jgi:tripartite-type tricarboxylate transporter receptor subunit TctC
MGQEFPIEVKVGNNSITAQEELYKALPDGYTLLVGTIITNSLVPVAHRKKFPFDYDATVLPVTRIADFPSILVTSPSTPAATLKELVELHKAKSTPLKNGTDFAGSTSHLASVLLGSAHGIRVEQVFINGATGLLNAVSTGEIDTVFLNSGTAGPAVLGGRVKALAVTGDKRLSEFPDVPTMSEAGFGGFAEGMWQGLFARNGTPSHIVKLLHEAVVKAMNSTQARSDFGKANASITLSKSSDEFSTELKAERVRWEKALSQAGLFLD